MSGVMHVTEFFIICWKAMPIAFYPPLNFRNQEKKICFRYPYDIALMYSAIDFLKSQEKPYFPCYRL